MLNRYSPFMEKIMDKKNFQKNFSTKFLVELQGTFVEFFRTWNYLNNLSELLARIHVTLPSTF